MHIVYVNDRKIKVGYSLLLIGFSPEIPFKLHLPKEQDRKSYNDSDERNSPQRREFS
jgi:hypothetical protein